MVLTDAFQVITQGISGAEVGSSYNSWLCLVEQCLKLLEKLEAPHQPISPLSLS
jgi:hypothetical protein